MQSLKQLEQYIRDGESLDLLTRSLGELASAKLQRIRGDVAKNRQFFAEISKVYKMVKIVAAQRNIPNPKKVNRSVSVMLTANYRFYGDIYEKLVGYFLDHTRGVDTDRIIIGKTGIEQVKLSNYQQRYHGLIFKGDLPSYDELKFLAKTLLPYKRVLLFYSRSKTILSQVPETADITASPLSGEVPKQPIYFIFEPEIPKILDFFDTQITVLLLEQTFFEAELSRLSARLIAMSQAQDNSKAYLKRQRGLFSSVKKSINNIRLLETLMPEIAWRNLQKT